MFGSMWQSFCLPNRQDIYPYVFDSLAKTKLAAGFIKGVKMSLPSGFERKDDRDLIFAL